MFGTITHAVADAQIADRHGRAGAAREARQLRQENSAGRARGAAARMSFLVRALRAAGSHTDRPVAATPKATSAIPEA